MSRLNEVRGGDCKFVIEGVPVVKCVRMEFHVDETDQIVFTTMPHLRECLQSMRSVPIEDESRIVSAKIGDWSVETILKNDLMNAPRTPRRNKRNKGAMKKSSEKRRKLCLQKGSGRQVINEVSFSFLTA